MSLIEPNDSFHTLSITICVHMHCLPHRQDAEQGYVFQTGYDVYLYLAISNAHCVLHGCEGHRSEPMRFNDRNILGMQIREFTKETIVCNIGRVQCTVCIGIKA